MKKQTFILLCMVAFSLNVKANDTAYDDTNDSANETMTYDKLKASCTEEANLDELTGLVRDQYINDCIEDSEIGESDEH